MRLDDPLTHDERAAAARRYDQVVGRGARLRHRRRRLTAAVPAAVVVLAVGVTLLLVAGNDHGTVTAAAPPPTSLSAPPGSAATVPPPTTIPPTTIPPTTSPPTTTVPLAVASAQLDAYVSAEAATDTAAARQAGQAWNGSLHSPPVDDQGSLVAVAAFSYDPGGRPLQVLGFTGGGWHLLAALAAPQCPCSGGHPGSYWLSYDTGASIAVADVTGDGRPDFLVPLNGADNVPGAVVSQDGTIGSTTWRYVPFTGLYRTNVVERSPQFRGDTLVSTFDSCIPDCAAGTNTTVTWTYERSSGVFWAPDPPGWTAPAGATNQPG